MATPTQFGEITRPTEPRIPPLDPTSLTDAQRRLAGIGAPTVILTLVRRADILEAIGPIGAMLLTAGQLSARDRELAILRVALRTRSTYEWGNHVLAALAGRASESEIAAVADESATWSAGDAALLRAVDELCSDYCISDDTWTALREAYTDDEIIEIIYAVGYYQMMAGFLNSAGVQPEPGRAPLGELPDLAPPPAGATPDPDAEGFGSPEGTWDVTMRHPVGAQELTLVITADDDAVTGSATNKANGITAEITSGTVDGSRISCRTLTTEPIRIETDWRATVTGNSIAGEVTVAGGAFPFDGLRRETGNARA